MFKKAASWLNLEQIATNLHKAPSTVMVGRAPPADVLFDDDERTEDTGLRPFVSARHAYLCVVAREHEDDKKDKFYITPLFRIDLSPTWFGGA